MRTLRKKIQLWFALSATLLACAALAPHLCQAQACSLTGLNGNCTLTIKRLRPIVPPTIYVRHGKKVTVILTDPLPYEDISLDRKSTGENPPVDQFQNGFSALTTALSGLTVFGTPISLPTQAALREPLKSDNSKSLKTKQFMGLAQLAPLDLSQKRQAACNSLSSGLTYKKVKACQDALQDELTGKGPNIPGLKDPLYHWSAIAICMVHNLLLPAGSIAVEPTTQPKPCDGSSLPFSIPSSQPEWTEWKKDFKAGYDETQIIPSGLIPPAPKFDDYIQQLSAVLDYLDGVLADTKKSFQPDKYLVLSSEQAKLRTLFSAYTDLKARMAALYEKVNSLPDKLLPSVTTTVDDPDCNSRNRLTAIRDLNSSNRLAPTATAIKADKFVADTVQRQLSTIVDPPVKQTIVELTVQFMSVPIFELASGIVVPIKPYHSYSVQTPYGAATSGGTCPPTPSTPSSCGTVAYTPSTTFIPAAMGSVPLYHEYARPGIRFAVLGTGVAGYSTASTSAALGGGPSFSFGSFVLNLPIMWDRTQKLTGGFQVGQSAGSATAPTTKNVWAWSPALGISVRIPLSGSSQ